MENIIILGEEYWFNKNSRFIEATYLLDFLEKYRNKKKYNYIIIKNPNELINTIFNNKSIKAIFLFQDVLSDSYLNNKTIYEMKKYLENLENNGIYIYPSSNVIELFGSKKYNLILNNKLSWASLPHTKVFYMDNYKNENENKIFTGLYKIVEKLWKIFNKVVIKKGYSYEGKQVQIFNKDKIKDFYDFKNKANKLNNKNFWGIITSSKKIDIGITRYYIIQGFNKIVSKKKNEYRVFFHNGKAKFIAKGDNIPNTCIADGLNLPLQKEIIKFAKKLFKEFIPLFWKNKRLPILFRVDVSFATNKEFQDEYSINVEGYDKSIRLYANELEIDPTSFFYNSFECELDDNFSSEKIQTNMAKYITKYIREL
jgi:hypothetical protein